MLLLLLTMIACQPDSLPANQAPTVVPFPTMTPGRVLHGVLPTVVALPLDGSGLANPATAVALANRPTPTPDYTNCPASGETDLAPAPATSRQVAAELARFLSSGVDPADLERRLRDDWPLLVETGLVRTDLDLTGEGQADVLLAYNLPDEGGALVVLTCADGRFTPRYEAAFGGTTPELLHIGDMNVDGTPEILFTSEICADDCYYSTQVITWRGDLGRFVSLLGGPIESATVPVAQDMDSDRVAEIVIQMNNAGSAATGPLRTGMTIFDWNGAGYVQSITQLDPPRFRIQVLHEADRALTRLEANEAIALYELALQSPELQAWHNGEEPILQGYALYRLLLAHAYAADEDLLASYQRIVDAYPVGTTPPVYVDLATTFWNAYQVTNNLRSACIEVREVIDQKPEAVALLNRYGSRSPVYDPATLCPF